MLIFLHCEYRAYIGANHLEWYLTEMQAFVYYLFGDFTIHNTWFCITIRIIAFA